MVSPSLQLVGVEEATLMSMRGLAMEPSIWVESPESSTGNLGAGTSMLLSEILLITGSCSMFSSLLLQLICTSSADSAAVS